MLRFSPSDGLAISALLLLFHILLHLRGAQGLPRPVKPHKMRITPNVTHNNNHSSQPAPKVIHEENNETSDSRFAYLSDSNVNSSLTRTRIKRSNVLQSGLESAQQRVNRYASDDPFPTSEDISGTYTTETLPDDLETLRPNQWIFFRICTQPMEPRNYYPDGIEEHVREKIKFSSCLSTNIKRPVFRRNQNLIIAVRGAPAVQFEILNRRTHILLPTFDKSLVKIWLHKSRDTVLLGLRPQAKHNHQVMELRLETHLRPGQTGKTINSLPVSWKSKRLNKQNLDRFAQRDEQLNTKLLTNMAPLLTQTGSNHFSKPFSRDRLGQAEAVHTVYLKQFTLRFSQDQFKLSLRCNKTGPFILYDPSPIGNSKLDTQQQLNGENATYQTGSDGTKMKADNGGSFDIAETVDMTSQSKEIKQSSNLLDEAIREYFADGASRPSTLSTELLIDTDTPELIAITEAMDELAIRLAQPYLDPNPKDTEEHTVGTIQRTSQSLLVPTEPTSRTLVQVVQVNETLRFTCQGLVPDGQLRVLYDQDAWQELHDPLLSFHNMDGSDQELQVSIQATRITWVNITQANLDYGLRQIDALTNVKCGSYRSSQLTEHPLRTYVQRTNPVEQLYFVIVAPEDYKFITNQLTEKLTDTFESIRQTLPNSITEKEQSNMLQAFLPNGVQGTKSETSKYQNLGFWNLSLSNLSNVKLLLTVAVVTLIISFIVLIIRNYGQMHTELTRDTVISRWDSSGQGDSPNVSQSKVGHESQCTGASMPRIREDNPPVRRALRMTNSNAADHFRLFEDRSKLSNQSAPLMLTESNDFIQDNTGLVRRPKKTVN